MRLYLSFLTIVIVLMGAACKDNDSKTTTSDEKTYAIAKVSTRLGDMRFWLHDETPNHKAKFIGLAQNEHYNQFTFNRVVKDFVIQGGCPDSPQYFTDSPYLLDPEFNDSLLHVYGALGMGRDNNPEKRSNACQFYIVSKEAGLPNLDGNYMIFGQLIQGVDVLEAIEHVDVDGNDQPEEEIMLDVHIERLTAQFLLDSLGFDIP